MEGQRNNHMLRFAMLLVDSGLDFITVRDAVNAFNGKLSNGLSQAEIDATVMVSIAKRYSGARR